MGLFLVKTPVRLRIGTAGQIDGLFTRQYSFVVANNFTR